MKKEVAKLVLLGLFNVAIIGGLEVLHSKKPTTKTLGQLVLRGKNRE